LYTGLTVIKKKKNTNYHLDPALVQRSKHLQGLLRGQVQELGTPLAWRHQDERLEKLQEQLDA
jgi:hypothetical protein